MRNKGFTLIELLAVIVILAIVALIATPLIMGVIEKAQTSAYEASLRGVFEATDLYVASDKFNGFPDEGIPIVDDSIKLKNKEFTSGKIIKNEEGQLVLQDISNGVYCGSGTINDLVVVKGNCYSADTTPPTDVSIGSSTVTSNSITIVAAAMDVESAISGYEFSSDDGSTWTSIQTSNVYTFTGLTNNTNYTFKIRATNNNDLTTESESLIVNTNDIPLPTYSISTTDWTDSAVVTITYPDREEGYVYEYSLDGASTWEEVVSPATTKDITFTDNGSVIARISDGVNEVSASSYDVTNIDTTSPVITVSPMSVKVNLGDAYVDNGVTASDVEMGNITSDIVVTGSVNTSTEGTYTLTYNVSDAAGNVAIEKTRTVIVEEYIYTFTYTGNYQLFSIGKSGTYNIEVWGAQGGSYDGAAAGAGGRGGKGGYAVGEINLNSGTNMYIYVGGSGSTGGTGSAGGWNGGGQGGVGVWGPLTGGGGGGGATDIRINSTSLNNRVVVAGGGGGGGASDGGYGGGSTGGTATGAFGGSGGTQSSGGTSVCGSSCNGGYGYGGPGGPNNGSYPGGGGGSGYYGGGGGRGYGDVSGYDQGRGGGGGSSYIGGVTSGQTIAGNTTMPNPSGGTMTGRSGHGYAKITFISQ